MSDDMHINLKAIAASVSIAGVFYGAVSFANRVENKADSATTTNVKQDAELDRINDRMTASYDRLARIETTMGHISGNIEEIKQAVKTR